MTAPHRFDGASLARATLVAALLLALPVISRAQTMPASSSSSAPMSMGSMSGMDHSGTDDGSMPGMAMPAAPTTVAAPAQVDIKPAASASSDDGMKGMDHGAMSGMHGDAMPETSQPKGGAKLAPASTAMPGMDNMPMPGKTTDSMKKDHKKSMPTVDHAAMPGMDHGSMPGMAQHGAASQDAMSGMNMDAMQGGSAPPDARSPDYSDGVSYGSMKPHMGGQRAIGMLLADQLEAVDSRNGNGQSFELSGWYGRDIDKLWLRSEGDVSHGKLTDGDVEAFWNHAIATYWGAQLGARHDLGEGPNRDWLAFGVEGLAPYWFKLEATGYVGASGRTAARLRANYEVLFTQRLILEPELEFNLYGKDDPARRIGSGLSDASLGLRLRYEIRREFAPYIGINWVRRIGTTADYARADGQHVFDQQFVAGLRIWF